MPSTVEQLKERASPWIQPISPEAPGGAVATTDPRYEFVRNEAAKLDSPTGAGTVQWRTVIDQGGELLGEKSKDFLVAVYVAYGLYIDRGLDGLLTGLVMLTELVEQYWTTMFPDAKRIRGRVNALTWFIERVSILLPTTQVNAGHRAVLEDLAQVTKNFVSVVRAKFENNAPALGPLVENVDRLVMSLPAEAPPPPPPSPPPPAGSAPQEAPSPAPQQAAPPPVAASPSPAGPAMPSAPAAAAPADAAGVADFLRSVGNSISEAALTLRTANLNDATAYRLARIAVWLPISNAPAGQGGKTALPPPGADMRASYERMAANEKWAALLDETESSLIRFRFWLDLQRFAIQALAGLGPGAAKAKEAALIEFSSFLRRLPTLVDLSFNDGTPFADPQTKMWIESEVMVGPAGSGGGGGGGAANDGLAEAVTEARGKMTAGQVPDGIAVLMAKINGAPSTAARFRGKLALAKLCLGTGQTALAKALYEGLEKDATTFGLDQWDPPLAAEALEGLVSCLRSVAKGGKPLPPETGLLYDRLCRVDPAVAAKLGA